MAITERTVRRRALRHVPRSRGAVSGLLVVLLGLWGGLIPFVGPAFHYGYTPDDSWYWTSGRGWLEVLPGAVAVVGGLLLLASRSRFAASFGGWLAAVSGAWFVLGPTCAELFHMGPVGQPLSDHQGTQVLDSIGLFSGVGGLLLIISSFALGRLSLRSARDLRAAERSLEKEAQAAEQAQRVEKDRTAEQLRVEQERSAEQARLEQERNATLERDAGAERTATLVRDTEAERRSPPVRPSAADLNPRPVRHGSSDEITITRDDDAEHRSS